MALQLFVQPRAGELIGQGLMQAAEGITQGIERFYKRKEENQQIDAATDASLDLLRSNRFMADAVAKGRDINSPDFRQAMRGQIKTMGVSGYMNFLGAAQQMAAQQREEERKQANMAAYQKARALGGDAQQQFKYFVDFGGDPTEGAKVYGQMADMAQFNPEVIRLPNGQEVIRTSPNSAQVVSGDFAGEGPMMDKDGNYLGNAILDRKTGKRYLEGPGGQRMDIPQGAQPVTATGLSKGIPGIGDFKKMSEAVADAEISLRNMDRYIREVGNTNQGIERLADKFSAGVKTLLGKGLNFEEVALKAAEGQLQGLLGANRTNVVGGGVMTEQDALRIIARLGGDVNALQNPQIVRRAIAQVYADRYKQYENDLGFYNAGVDQYYGNRGFRPKDPVKFNTSFAQELAAMGDEAAPADAAPAAAAPANDLAAAAAAELARRKGKR